MLTDRRAFARALVAGLLCFAFLTVRRPVGDLAHAPLRPALATALLLVAAVFGLTAVRLGAAAAFSAMRGQQAVLWRNLVTWTLSGVLVLALAADAGVNLSGLLVGGAIVGVIVGSASQAALGNFFAGLVLLVTAPFRIGDQVRIRTLASPTEYEGRVIDARAQHTTILTRTSDVVRLPNSAVLNAILTVGATPEVDLTLELPSLSAVDGVRRTLHEELANQVIHLDLVPVAATVADGGAGGRLECRLRLRTAEPVDADTIARALGAAVAAGPSGGAERELASRAGSAR